MRRPLEPGLYISTALHQVAAVDAATGDTLWVHDPKAYLGGSPTHFYNSRGVAYWADDGDARIFFGTSEGYLLALDASTGQPILDFGNNGRVDLMEGIPRAVRGETNYRGRNLLGVASPRIVAHDIVVTPTVISDGAIRDSPSLLFGMAVARSLSFLRSCRMCVARCASFVFTRGTLGSIRAGRRADHQGQMTAGAGAPHAPRTGVT